MSTQISRRRGTSSQHTSFVGAEGELTIDTDKNTVIVHDGSTPGGHPLPTLDGAETLTNKTLGAGSTIGSGGVVMTGGGSLDDYTGFATRAAFISWQSGKTPAVGTVIYAAGLGYVYLGGSGGVTSATAWHPLRPVNPKHFGAVGDWNGTTGTDDLAAFTAMATWMNANGCGKCQLTAAHLVSGPVVFASQFGVEIETVGGFAAQIVGSHTSGPVLHVKKSWFKCDGVTIDATAARAAAAYSAINAGILIADVTWDNLGAGGGASGALCEIRRNIARNQPGPGILTLGGGGAFEGNDCSSNKGHGIWADNGVGVGVSMPGFPGWTRIIRNRAQNNGGHGIAVGNDGSVGSSPMYRMEVLNNDVNDNATDAAVRYTQHQIYIVGEQVETAVNVCKGAGPGMYIAGRNQHHLDNRFVGTDGEAYEIGDIAGFGSAGITIDGLRVIIPVAALNPAVKIASSLSVSRGLVIKDGHGTDITKLVADADRAKVSEYLFKDDHDFRGTLRVGGVSIVPATEGTFTPTFSFATPGDLAVTYVSQVGYYKKFEGFAFIQLFLQFTLTHSTASGVAVVIVPGLSFSFDADAGDRSPVSIADLNRCTFLAGQLQAMARVNSSGSFRLQFAVSAGAAADSAPANFPSGTANASIALSGWVKLA